MRQQHGDLGIVEDMLRSTAEDDLFKAAAGERALEHQVGANVTGLVEDDLASAGRSVTVAGNRSDDGFGETACR